MPVDNGSESLFTCHDALDDSIELIEADLRLLGWPSRRIPVIVDQILDVRDRFVALRVAVWQP